MTEIMHTTYPIMGPSPVLCENGENHYLHMVSRWDSGVELTYEGPVYVRAPRRLGVEFSTMDTNKSDVPVNKFVRIPVNRQGIADLSTVSVDYPAEVMSEDIGLLEDATRQLNQGVVWHFTRNYDGTGLAYVEPKDLTVQQPHYPGESLVYTVHSSSLILAGLRLLARESVMRHIGSLQ